MGTLTASDYIFFNCIHYNIIHAITWLLAITSIANKQASVTSLYTLSNCNNNDVYLNDTCTMHKNILNTRTIYDYHTISNTLAFCLVNKANTITAFEQNLFTYCWDIGKLSAKIFKWPNNSQRSYNKNLVAYLIIRPQESTGK